MDWLEQEPRDVEVLDALTMTLAADFRGLPDPAGTYRQWWDQYADAGAAEVAAPAEGANDGRPETGRSAGPEVAFGSERVGKLRSIGPNAPAAPAVRADVARPDAP